MAYKKRWNIVKKVLLLLVLSLFLMGNKCDKEQQAFKSPGGAEKHSARERYSQTGTPVAPEPISSILFLSGGATLAIRSYLKNKRRQK